jgi:Flp pilus assembly pilin Flp
MHRIRNQPRCGRGEDGQTTVEYAVILAALAIAAIVALVFMSGTLRGTFRRATPSPDIHAGSSPDAQTFLPPVTCDTHYSGACIPPPPPDLDCEDLAHMGITGTIVVSDSDPHHLDTDGDGIACN